MIHTNSHTSRGTNRCAYSKLGLTLVPFVVQRDECHYALVDYETPKAMLVLAVINVFHANMFHNSGRCYCRYVQQLIPTYLYLAPLDSLQERLYRARIDLLVLDVLDEASVDGHFDLQLLPPTTVSHLRFTWCGDL